MYRIYLSKIKAGLKQRLKGDVTVALVNDTVIITVYNSTMSYQRTYYSLSEKIWQGTPADLFVSDFISHYKQAIFKSCFK